MKLMQVDVPIPDFTSLAKRAANLNVSLDVARRSGPLDIVVDSTGLKVFGEGEWKARKHGASKQRTWRKLHLAANPETHEIEAMVLTENSGTTRIRWSTYWSRFLIRLSPSAATVLTINGRFTWHWRNGRLNRSFLPAGTRRLNSMAIWATRRCRGTRRFAKFATSVVSSGNKTLVIIVAACRKQPCIA